MYQVSRVLVKARWTILLLSKTVKLHTAWHLDSLLTWRLSLKTANPSPNNVFFWEWEYFDHGSNTEIRGSKVKDQNEQIRKYTVSAGSALLPT